MRQGMRLEPLLQAIADFLDDQKEMIERVRRDLVRGLKRPGSGRRGLTPQQTLRVLDRDAATLDPTEFTQLAHKGVSPWTPARGIRSQKTDGRYLARRLRARRERPGDGRAAEEANELTSLHIRPSSGASIVSV